MHIFCNKATFIFLILSLALTIACNQNNKKPLDVLLVGNSSIYYNNMPKMLEHIARENGQELRTKLIAFGGYTLRDHLNEGLVEKTLDSRSWDFVILNEQSTLGENYVVNGIRRVKESESFYMAVREFYSIIEKRGAKTVILSLYPRKNALVIDGKILDYSYMKIAKELGMVVAPVSQTWTDILKAKNNWKLYRDDNLHPTPLGSFITANVIFSTIYDRKSKPINGVIKGPLIELFDGFERKDSIVTLIDINEFKSRMISNKSFRNNKKLKQMGGYLYLKYPN